MTVHVEPTETLPEFASPLVRRVILGVFPALAVLQWVLVLPLSRAAGTWWSLDGSGLAADKHVPFMKDFFYMAWNLLPVVLWVLTLGALSRIRRSMPELQQRFDTEASKRLLQRFSAVGRSRSALVVIGLLALYACYAQFPKQQGFIEQQTYCYWWDRRISMPIFWVRIFALFTNTILVVYILWRVAVFQMYLAVLSRSESLSPSFLHADGSCGLKCFGSVSSWLFFPWILVALVGVAGMLDHGTEQGLHNTLGDLAMTSFPVIIGLAFFFYPASRIARRLNGMRSQVLRDLEPPVERWSRESGWRGGSDGGILDSDGLLKYQAVSQASAWPFNAAILARVLMAAVAPAITYLLRSFVLK